MLKVLPGVVPRPIFLPLKLITPLTVWLISFLTNWEESILSKVAALTDVRLAPLPLKLVAVTDALNTAL